MSSDTQHMARKELRHDRHAVSLLTDNNMITPKCRRNILVEKTIALAVEGVIRTTCKGGEVRSSTMLRTWIMFTGL